MNTLNILSLWIERLHRTKQSPSRRFYLRALAEREDVRFHQSGPGFPDWDDSLSGMQNISRLMPDCHAVISYKALGGCEYGRVNNPEEVAKHCLTVEQMNECHAGFPGGGGAMHPGGSTAAAEMLKGHIRLIVLHHENDRQRMQSVLDYGAKLVHIPHCAHPMFAEEARPWNERHGIVLTGVLNAQHYPLRQRWYDLIQSGRIKGAYFRRPGNYTESVEQSDALVRQYARVLGSACVKLGCSSVWRYNLQHFSESAMAGTIQVSDAPLPRLPGARSTIHEVSPEDSDERLIAAVERAEAMSEQWGRDVQDVAKKYYTTAHYAERLVSEIRGML